MTGYVSGTLADPEGADELLRTAAESLEVAEQLDCPRLNLHGTGLDDRGLPVDPRRRGHAGDVAGRRPDARPASPSWASGPAGCSRWRT